MARLPKGFHRQADDTIVCPHRDVTCCDVCTHDHNNLRPMMGVVYCMSDAELEAFFDGCGEYADQERANYDAEVEESNKRADALRGFAK